MGCIGPRGIFLYRGSPFNKIAIALRKQPHGAWWWVDPWTEKLAASTSTFYF